MNRWWRAAACLFAFAIGDAAALPVPAVEVLAGPPPGNYCNSKRATALFNVNTHPPATYYGQGTFKVNGQVVYTSDIGHFYFPPGVWTAEWPLPLEVLPGPTYPPGTVFSTTSRYFDSSMRATYENEIAIRCDSGETVLIRNVDLTVQPVPVKGVAPLATLMLAASGALVLRRTKFR
jgi:hypothetical protein